MPDFCKFVFLRTRKKKKKKAKKKAQPLYLCSQPLCLLLTHHLLHTWTEEAQALLQHLSPPPAEQRAGEIAASSRSGLGAGNRTREAGAALPDATLHIRNLPQRSPLNASTGTHASWKTNHLPTGKCIKPRGNGILQV